MGCSSYSNVEEKEGGEDKKNESKNNKDATGERLTLKNKDGKKENGGDEKDKNQSNVDTEERNLENGEKNYDMKKMNFRGVTLLHNVGECFPDDVTQEFVQKMVLDALDDNIVEKRDLKPGKNITREQAIAVSKILYSEVKKQKSKEEDKKDKDKNKSKDKDDSFDDYEIVESKDKNGMMKEYIILKGFKVKIGVTELTKEVVRNVFYPGEKVNDLTLEITYNKLTKSGGTKALMIELVP